MNLKPIITSVTLLLLVLSGTSAQNLQLHYDTRHSLYGNEIAPINYLTATYEMFKPDKWGSTFLFVDFDFNFDNRNPGLVYGEIARDIKIGNFPLMAHIEYNGGLGLIRGTNSSFSISSAYLAGASYPFKLGDFFLGTYLAYKLWAFEKLSHDAQWTITWSGTVANKKLTINGFLDVWTENKNRQNTDTETGKKVVFITEPQIWYNLTPQVSIGSETEISRNFIGNKNKVYFIPTIATKWTF